MFKKKLYAYALVYMGALGIILSTCIRVRDLTTQSCFNKINVFMSFKGYGLIIV